MPNPNSVARITVCGLVSLPQRQPKEVIQGVDDSVISSLNIDSINR